jgi:hypothetical protein
MGNPINTFTLNKTGDLFMLTISEVARRHSLSNRQVHEMVRYGYLNVADIKRRSGRGLTYLFSEQEVNNLDVPFILQEISYRKRRHPLSSDAIDFRRVNQVLNYYDRFLESIQEHPYQEFLMTCFYLFHLNHYAKKYQELSTELYQLKNQVIRKLYNHFNDLIEAVYLLGPDRKRIWLCEDCKESARAAGMSYVDYLKKGYYCPKCTLGSVDKEYYSLVEFRIVLDDYRFTFHLPRTSALRWMKNLDSLPQSIRDMGNYQDHMYLYGRTISRIEERILPLPVILEKLQQFLATDLTDNR